MFTDCFVTGCARTRRAWTAALGGLFQVAIVLTLIAVPLVKPDLLPRAVLNVYGLTAPTPPPAPPPPPPPGRQALAARPRPEPGRFTAPASVPPTVLMIEEPLVAPDAGAGAGGGVEGGVTGGREGGVISSILSATVASSAPPLPPPVVRQPEPQREPTIRRIEVGGNVQEGMLVRKVTPTYPRLAVQARVEGTVSFKAVISPAGTVQQLRLVSGHPLLVGAATEAVKQWLYRPTLLNGVPVEVDTVIHVHFILNR
jgi:protein TonB